MQSKWQEKTSMLTLKICLTTPQIVYTIGVITVVGFLIHIVCLFVFSFVFASQISNF